MRYTLAVALRVALGCAGHGLPKITDEIKTLTLESAKALAQHKGTLFLNGLTTLSDEAAKALEASANVYLPATFKR